MPYGIKTTVIGCRLTESVLMRLKARAAAEKRQVAALVAIVVEEWLDASDQGRPPGAPGAVHWQRAPEGSPPALEPASAPAMSTEVRVIAAMAAISAQIRAEQNRPLGAINSSTLSRLLKTEFLDVTDLHSARAKGPGAWADAGSGPGLIAQLFPDDREAVARAKKQKNAIKMSRRIEGGSEVQRFISSKGIVGRGSVNVAAVLAKFPGLTPTEAVNQGPQAWLDRGLGEESARKIFDERTAATARRLRDVRGNNRKKGLAA